ILEHLEDAVENGLDVAAVVRRKIADLSVEKVAQIILSGARRELRADEILGGVLGVLIGLGQAGLLRPLAERYPDRPAGRRPVGALRSAGAHRREGRTFLAVMARRTLRSTDPAMRLPGLLALSLVPAAAQALTPAPGKIPMRPKMEYLRPFRNPDKNLQPPMELYEELRTMLAIARDPSVKKSYDEEGREVCDHSAWREAMSRAQIKSARMGGYLAVVCQESGDAGDRALALYGAYWLDSLQDTISILALIPGEPVPHLREEA